MNRPDKPSNVAKDDRDASTDQTPSTDMQPEDTGTADSGNSAQAAEKAVKQTTKTPAEQGGKS
ncbi:hypothetical protein [Ramlibacter sp. WS9]|uniref:hypothetical protein n=1 Tax=Ramlibacter sp. WS9 TaxID=1882741 RepID=UPI0011414B00|nr:hypothetical protein [Ramlibacter sp. WS9]ROZ76614.1 hypothetical protein EEB15_12255 [Ramlibacter sp. WS9]